MVVGGSFPEEEYKLRYKKARELMEKDDLDALMATDITNYVYLGGHKVRLFMAGSRPQALILPREGEPVLIAQRLFEQLANKTSYVTKMKFWQDFPFMVETIREALEEQGLSKGRIGVDLGGEYLMGLQYQSFERLKKIVPAASFVDGTTTFLQLRLKKTPREIECMKKACDMTSRAYEKFFENLKPGMSEKQIANLMISYMMEEGSEDACWTHPRIFPGAELLWQPTDHSLEKGRTLFVDSGASCKGYVCDFSRLAVVGEAPSRLQEMYELCRSITWKEVDATRPGIKASDIANVGSAELKKAELKAKPAGRDGHGLGLGGLELPSICPRDDTILEPGMIITMEPEISSVTLKPDVAAGLPEFRFVQEENVLVTENGYEVLSWASRGLHKI